MQFELILVFFTVWLGSAALEASGMDRKKARFQALSALTGTGFTTGEAGISGQQSQKTPYRYLADIYRQCRRHWFYHSIDNMDTRWTDRTLTISNDHLNCLALHFRFIDLAGNDG